MRILISNDDGIHAEGIKALCKALNQHAELVVVAPNQQRSASSHGISLHRAIQVDEVNTDFASIAYQTSGTPVDCVKWAMAMLHPQQPFDLMLSGINAGANLATDVLYSGTIAAAGEASLQGVKSIALSLVGPPFHFEEAAVCTYDIIEQLRNVEVPSDTFLSVNFPASADPNKLRWTTLGVRTYHDKYRIEVDESGQQVYRYGGDIIDERGEGDTDVEAIRDGYISVTPLRYRFLNEEFYQKMKS